MDGEYSRRNRPARRWTSSRKNHLDMDGNPSLPSPLQRRQRRDTCGTKRRHEEHLKLSEHGVQGCYGWAAQPISGRVHQLFDR